MSINIEIIDNFLSAEDLKEPQWSKEWDKTMQLNIIIDENGDMTDSSPFIWTSPPLIDSNSSDPV